MRTALFNLHQKLGARFIDFGGWELPLQFTSIVEEHHAVRNAGGIFDISHMGEVTIAGAAAQRFLNQVLTNDAAHLEIGQGHYTLLCNERGGTIDDLYAFHVAPELYLLIVNASRIQTDVSWLQEQAAHFADADRLIVGNASENYAAVAVQGPRVREFIDRCLPGSSEVPPIARISELQKNQIGKFHFEGTHIFVSCTGYTGEDGFEIIGLNHTIETIWERVIEAGKPVGLVPAGLGARDTLRTEMGYPLYGHELDENTTPIEAGLGGFVALQKGEFVGRPVLAEQKANGVARKCVAFRMTGKSAPPRPSYPIWSPGAGARPVGKVTSGTQSPSLGIGIGMGYLPAEFAQKETPIAIEIRGVRAPAVVAPKPLYRKAV